MSLQKRLQQAHVSKFVGRDEQIDVFLKNLTSKIPIYPFIQIAGQGGIGKSTLLKQFQTICIQQQIPFALTDHEEKNPPAAMHRLAESLEESGFSFKSFKEQHSKYHQLKEKIQRDPEKPDTFAQFFSQAAGKSVVMLGKTTPITSAALDLIGADVIEDQISNFSNYLFQKLSNKDDVRLILEPTTVLSPLFVADINKIATDTQIVLMFDTFEETGPTLLPWLTKLFDGKYGELSEYISFVFAGRTFDRHDWLLIEPLLFCCNLEPFTEAETRLYLNNNGIHDSKDIEEIYHLSGGLPVYVAMLATQDSKATGKLNRTVVERFLRNIEGPIRRQTALQSALLRRIDKDILHVLHNNAIKSAELDALFSWLIELPFVQDRQNYWVYHPVVRTQMVIYQRNQSLSEFESIHQNLATYYHQKAQKLGSLTKDKWQELSWWPYYIEATFHNICHNPQENLQNVKKETAELILNADSSGIDSYAEAIKQAGVDLNNYEPAISLSNTIKNGLNLINDNKWGEAFKLFDTLGLVRKEPHNINFEAGVGVRELPIGWFATGSKPQKFNMGIDCCTAYNNKVSGYIKSLTANYTESGRLLQIIKANNYEGQRIRFSGYVKSKNIEEGAGLWMHLVGKANESLSFDNMRDRPIIGTSDWEKYEIVLDVPKGSTRIAFGIYLQGKGELWASNLDFEIVGLDVPTTEKSEPYNLDFGKGIGIRQIPIGWHRAGSYPQDYEMGVDQEVTFQGKASGYLKSKIVSKGFGTLMQMYKAKKYLGKRLCYSGYVKSKDVEEWAGLWMRVDGPEPNKSLSFDNMYDRPIKGSTDWTNYKIVLDVPDQSTNIAFGILLHGAGQVWLTNGNIEVVAKDEPTSDEHAIVQLTQAIQSTPNDAKLYYQRAIKYARMNKHEESIKDHSEAIRLNPKDESFFHDRGFVYHSQGNYEQAINDFNEAIKLNPKYAGAFYNLACAYANQESLKESLSALRQVLVLDHERYFNLIPNDTDFDLIRNRAEFKALIAEFENSSKV